MSLEFQTLHFHSQLHRCLTIYKDWIKLIILSYTTLMNQEVLVKDYIRCSFSSLQSYKKCSQEALFIEDFAPNNHVSSFTNYALRFPNIDSPSLQDASCTFQPKSIQKIGLKNSRKELQVEIQLFPAIKQPKYEYVGQNAGEGSHFLRFWKLLYFYSKLNYKFLDDGS